VYFHSRTSSNLLSKAGLFSAVSSAFVIDVHSNLKPDPNEQSAAFLRAILLTLNHSAIPGETPTVPPTQEDPPSEIVTASGLMYASLLISLLAAFIAMLGKQWLNRYLRNAGGSMIERCGDRQRKFDGLKKWPFHLFVESLPVMLQVALLLLACGLCRNMASINTSVATILISLTVLGVLFYLGIVITGTSSYDCPFQTPVSTGLRSSWKKIGPHLTSISPPIVATGTLLYRHLQCSWEDTLFLSRIIHALVWLPLTSRPCTLPITQPTPQEPALWLATLHSLWESIGCKILLLALHLPQIHLPQTTPLPIIPSTYQWLTPTALDTLQKTNTSDVQCVSWILWNITDPEALDTAIQLAATIWWFQDGLNTEPPYNLIVFTLKGCFDSTGNIYPGLRGRAYSSAQTILWIHICAMCVSEEFALRFPLPVIHCSSITSLDHDLGYLIGTYTGWDTSGVLAWMYANIHIGSPAHSQWTSNAVLHLSWAKQDTPSTFHMIRNYGGVRDWDIVPVGIILDYLLVLSIILGQSVGEKVLKVQDKSYVISFFILQPAQPAIH
jgi:hypothetical protein